MSELPTQGIWLCTACGMVQWQIQNSFCLVLDVAVSL